MALPQRIKFMEERCLISTIHAIRTCRSPPLTRTADRKSFAAFRITVCGNCITLPGGNGNGSRPDFRLTRPNAARPRKLKKAFGKSLLSPEAGRVTEDS